MKINQMTVEYVSIQAAETVLILMSGSVYLHSQSWLQLLCYDKKPLYLQ